VQKVLFWTSLRRKTLIENNNLGGHRIAAVVLLGKALVTEELCVNTASGREAVALGLLDTVAVVLLVLVVISVILALCHF